MGSYAEDLRNELEKKVDAINVDVYQQDDYLRLLKEIVNPSEISIIHFPSSFITNTPWFWLVKKLANKFSQFVKRRETEIRFGQSDQSGFPLNDPLLLVLFPHQLNVKISWHIPLDAVVSSAGHYNGSNDAFGGYSALELACWSGCIQVVDGLLASRATGLLDGQEGEGQLGRLAVLGGNPEVLKSLLKAGYNIEEFSTKGCPQARSTLPVAIATHQFEVVKFIYENRNNHTDYDLIQAFSDSLKYLYLGGDARKIVDYLFSKGVDVNNPVLLCNIHRVGYNSCENVTNVVRLQYLFSKGLKLSRAQLFQHTYQFKSYVEHLMLLNYLLQNDWFGRREKYFAIMCEVKPDKLEAVRRFLMDLDDCIRGFCAMEQTFNYQFQLKNMELLPVEIIAENFYQTISKESSLVYPENWVLFVKGCESLILRSRQTISGVLQARARDGFFAASPSIEEAEMTPGMNYLI